MALRPFSPFRQAQYVQVSPLKPASFCKLSAGHGSTNKSAISLPFSSSLTLALFLPLCTLLHLSFYIKFSGRSGRNYDLLSPPALSGYKGPRTFVSPGEQRADELANGSTIYALSNPCSLSPLISRTHSSLFSDWRCKVSFKFFDAQVPSIFTEELALPHHACYVIFRLRYNEHSLL